MADQGGAQTLSDTVLIQYKLPAPLSAVTIDARDKISPHNGAFYTNSFSSKKRTYDQQLIYTLGKESCIFKKGGYRVTSQKKIHDHYQGTHDFTHSEDHETPVSSRT